MRFSMRQACAASGRMISAWSNGRYSRVLTILAHPPAFGLISAHKYPWAAPRRRHRRAGRNLIWSQFLWPHHDRVGVSFFNCQTTAKPVTLYSPAGRWCKRGYLAAPRAWIHTWKLKWH